LKVKKASKTADGGMPMDSTRALLFKLKEVVPASFLLGLA
jgi:hypothetical protein